MSALIKALDSHTPVQLGENGHTELAWSNDIQEKICQFDFQCVRTNSDGIDELSEILCNLLRRLSKHQISPVLEEKRKEHLIILYKLIGKTRDINGGKGECALSYMMIWKWYQYFPEMSIFALRLFVHSPAIEYKEDNSMDDEEPYGSWKDMKYMCKYLQIYPGCSMAHPLIQNCINLINNQLREDNKLYQEHDVGNATEHYAKLQTQNADVLCSGEVNSSVLENNKNKQISLAAKWIARETSNKFGFMYDALSANYFPEYMATAKKPSSIRKAQNKCNAQYRLLCATLNRHLDTIQIKQCSGNWASINHAKTTSITIAKQRKALLNLTLCEDEQTGKPRQRSEKIDRIKCAENLKAHMESLVKAGKEVKGKHVGLNKFTFDANRLLYQTNVDQIELDILNSQWRDNANQKNANGLGSMAAMVDMSGSMEGDPVNAATALGIRIAEKSILGKRVMTFSDEPKWINLDGCNTFTEMVHEINCSNRDAGTSTNFYAALDLMLTAIEEHRVPPEEVENMILVILSDMQIDDNLGGGEYYMTEQLKEAGRKKWDTMYLVIKQKYHDVGMRLYGKPMMPPHILFWNFRYTGGFPVLSSQGNTSMMSGFDPTILNMFCDMGMEALRGLTPFNCLVRSLDNVRYTPLEIAMRTHLNGYQ